MAEIIEADKKLPRKNRRWSIIALALVVIVLVVAGYIASQCTDCGLVDDNSQPVVGQLDYDKPFGLFLGLPVEKEVDLEGATLTQYEGDQEIVSISYKSAKTQNQIIMDFENFFKGNSWNIINKDDISIYGVKDIDSVNVLVEKKGLDTLITISYTKEIK